ncbi:MAG: basic amino acid ABC transporter substrate-binding protein [Brevinema sp.]
MKKIVLLTMAWLFVTGCTKSSSDTLIVGTNAEFQPFEYLENGAIVGFDIDIINEVALILEKKIKIENMSFDGLIPALQSKKIDLIVAGMAVTEDRKQSVNFSDSYFQTEDMRLIVQENNTSISNTETIANKNVGAILGFTADTYLTQMGNVTVSRFNGAGEAILALKAGKIDALMLDADPTRGYLAQNPDLKYFPVLGTAEQYSMAFRKEDTELLNSINNAILQLKENGKYQEIYAKYFLN